MLFSLGHSTLSVEAFLELAGPLDVIVDVRAFPGSRRFPHFAREPMSGWLAEAGFGYEWWPALGGRRSRVEPAGEAGELTSEETGWREPSFANYALLMTRDEWLRPVEELIVRAGGEGRPALGLLCAEALWWRCHRSLISDYLAWRGLDVHHLRLGGPPDPHSRTAKQRLGRYHPVIVRAWERWRAETRPC